MSTKDGGPAFPLATNADIARAYVRCLNRLIKNVSESPSFTDSVGALSNELHNVAVMLAKDHGNPATVAPCSLSLLIGTEMLCCLALAAEQRQTWHAMRSLAFEEFTKTMEANPAHQLMMAAAKP